MIWGMKAPAWFGIMLAGLALFVWCLLAMIERIATLAEGETLSAAYGWGLIIFGAATVVSAIITLVVFSSTGRVARARDGLTDSTSVPPRSAGGHALSGSGQIPRSIGGIPQRVSGRSIK